VLGYTETELKSMESKYTSPIGVRLEPEDRLWIDETVEKLSIPQSNLVRLLLRFSLNQIRKNPAVFFEEVCRC
jgi:hypothetical protein